MRAAIGVVLLGLMTSCAMAQQGGGGLGGGGGRGGGFGGGGAGGRAGRMMEGSDAIQVNQILTPGDTGEFPLTVKDGETIIARVTSQAFDPAVAILDAAGKTLIEVDDVRPGEQDGLALYRFTKATTCKVVVKGFKAKAGGPFDLTIQRFIPVEIKMAQRNAGSIPNSGRQWFRVPADAGQTMVITARAAAFTPRLSVIAPNGEPIQTDERKQESGRVVRSVYRAETKGDYFLKLGSEGNSGESYALTAALARIIPTRVGEAGAAKTLDAGGLDLWTFAAATGDILRIQARATAGDVDASVRRVRDAKNKEAVDEDDSSGAVGLPTNPKARGERLVLIRRAGSYQVSVSQPMGRDIQYSMSITRPERALNGNAVNDKLALGYSDYWTLDAKPGQILRFEASSDQFDPMLTLIDPTGSEIEVNDDGGGAGASLLTARVTESGRYLLRVHSYGDGGGGTYALRRIPDPIHSLKPGVANEGSVGSGSEDIWSFTGKAGQVIILSVRSREIDTFVRLFGPDVLEVAHNDDGGDGTDSLLSVKLPVDGIYTAWVSSHSGAGKYTIRIFNAD